LNNPAYVLALHKVITTIWWKRGVLVNNMEALFVETANEAIDSLRTSLRPVARRDPATRAAEWRLGESPAEYATAPASGSVRISDGGSVRSDTWATAWSLLDGKHRSDESQRRAADRDDSDTAIAEISDAWGRPLTDLERSAATQGKHTVGVRLAGTFGGSNGLRPCSCRSLSYSALSLQLWVTIDISYTSPTRTRRTGKFTSNPPR